MRTRHHAAMQGWLGAGNVCLCVGWEMTANIRQHLPLMKQLKKNSPPRMIISAENRLAVIEAVNYSTPPPPLPLLLLSLFSPLELRGSTAAGGRRSLRCLVHVGSLPVYLRRRRDNIVAVTMSTTAVVETVGSSRYFSLSTPLPTPAQPRNKR